MDETKLVACFKLVIFLLVNSSLFSQPQISSISPSAGPVGTVVTITGSNFSNSPSGNIVYFGSVRANVVSATSTALSVIVPVGATFSPVSVTTNGLIAFSETRFLITFSTGGVGLPNSFDHRSEHKLNFRPDFSAVGDLDGDGLPEIVVAEHVSFWVYILKNAGGNGVVSFVMSQGLIASQNPTSIKIGDLDGDGKLDLAIACSGAATIAVFRNTSSPGNITFSSRQNFTVGTNPTDLSINDFDGDGKADLAVTTDGSSALSILKNSSVTGAISFAPNTTIPTGSSSFRLDVADFNGDNKPDVAMRNFTMKSISIFRNTSSPGLVSFAPKIDLDPGILPGWLKIGDFDGDMKPDLAVAYNTQYFSIFRNASTGSTISFHPRADIPTTTMNAELALSDFDGDGKVDVALADYSGDKVLLFKNTSSIGTTTFASQVEVASGKGPRSLVPCDLDGNGKTDILASDNFAFSLSIIRNLGTDPRVDSFFPTLAGPGALVTLRGKRFVNTTQVTFGNVAAQSVNTLNDSTIQAVVATGSSGAISVTTTQGTGGLAGFNYTDLLTITSIYPTAGRTGSTVEIKGANFDQSLANNHVYFGAAKAKIISGITTSLFVEVPKGASYAPVTVTRGGLTARAATPFINTFPGTGSALTPQSFSPKQEFPVGTDPQSITAADFDSDGKVDLATANHVSNTLSTLMNTSSQGVVSFAPKSDRATGINPRAIASGDFDGDGKLDVAVANFGSNTISLFLNTSLPGSISFSQKIDLLSGNGPQSISLEDIDGDQRLDIAVANYSSNSVSIFLNQSVPGNISFASKWDIAVVGLPAAVHLSDLNNDQKPDLMVSSFYDYTASVYKNTSTVGSISFGGKQDYWSNISAVSIATGDLDDDGKPEMTVANANAHTASVFKNMSNTSVISFHVNEQFGAGFFPYHISVAEMDGDRKPDMVTVAYDEDAVVVLKNVTSGIGTFFAFNALGYPTGSKPLSAAIADIDGDGKPDIAVANRSSNSVSVLRNAVAEPLVVPSGTSPVSGTILHTLIMDSTVQLFNGTPYVQRHYDIVPINNPLTSTATITLYFTQEEFNNFNAHPAHGLNLPSSPSDIAGIAALRVYQFHGFSATSLPGSYSGGGVEINPDDNKIVWNPTVRWWEVTIDVNGFSGFFISSAGGSLLPLHLKSFTSKLESSHTAILEWITASETGLDYFELQRSTDGVNFSFVDRIDAVNTVSQAKYNFRDLLVSDQVYFYRLKIVEQTGNSSYSYIIRVTSRGKTSVLLAYPNPAKDFVILHHESLNQGADIMILDGIGRVRRRLRSMPGVSQTRVDLKDLTPGIYILKITSKGKDEKIRIVVE